MEMLSLMSMLLMKMLMIVMFGIGNVRLIITAFFLVIAEVGVISIRLCVFVLIGLVRLVLTAFFAFLLCTCGTSNTRSARN